MNQRKAGKWISIEDHLPQDGIEVLVSSPNPGSHYGEAKGNFTLAFMEEGAWCSSETGIMLEFSIDYFMYLLPPEAGGESG